MQIIVRTACGLVWLAALGCHSFSPYGPGYAGNYPTQPRGNFPQQGAYPQPALAMNTVPGQTWPQQPQLGAAGNVPPPAFASQPPQFDSVSMPPSATGSTGTKPVPDYDDVPGGPSIGSTGDEFRSPVASSRGAKLDARIDDTESADPGDDAFAPPVPVQNASVSRDIPEASPPVARSNSNPYLYDTKGYTWLRGIVDFDDQSKTWRITYNPDPRGDPFGGSLTLSDDEKLGSLLPNDVVLVEGRIDNDRRDRFSKPIYHVSNAVLLRPKSAPQ